MRIRKQEKQNRNELEQAVAGLVGAGQAVAVVSGRAALWFAVRLAMDRIAGSDGEAAKSDREDTVETDPNEADAGVNLCGRRVFCPDFASEIIAAVILSCGGVPVFVDASPDDWGMDPEALANAFERYPKVKLVIASHVYGFPGRIDAIKKICEAHGALLIEDASEALGAKYKGRYCGSFGDYGILDFGNAGMKGEDAGMNDGAAEGIGGMLLIYDKTEAERMKQQEESGEVLPGDVRDAMSGEPGKPYAEEQSKSQMDPAETAGSQGGAQYPGYEMADVTAGGIRELLKNMKEQIAGRIAVKKKIYERYADRLAELDIWMNPYDEENAEPNYQTCCMMISENGLSQARWEMRDGTWTYEYDDVHGRTCPPEIFDVLESFGVKSRLAWQPLHRMPLYRNFDFVMADGEQWDGESGCGIEFGTRAGAAGISSIPGEGEYLFERGLCLPSDAGMTEEEQERVIEMIGECFNEREWRR